MAKTLAAQYILTSTGISMISGIVPGYGVAWMFDTLVYTMRKSNATIITALLVAIITALQGPTAAVSAVVTMVLTYTLKHGWSGPLEGIIKNVYTDYGKCGGRLLWAGAIGGALGYG